MAGSIMRKKRFLLNGIVNAIVATIAVLLIERMNFALCGSVDRRFQC